MPPCALCSTASPDGGSAALQSAHDGKLSGVNTLGDMLETQTLQQPKLVLILMAPDV
jgi:hypothetical protein